MEYLPFSCRLACAAALIAFAGPLLLADEKSQVTGPLFGLPSKPGGHIDKITKLDNNTWFDLGSPAADPKWGKAMASSYFPLRT